MKSIEEIVEPFGITAVESKKVYKFLQSLSAVDGIDSFGPSKNRWLVGLVFAHRRVKQKEMDMADLVAITGIRRSSLRNILSSMKTKELVYFNRVPKDKRRHNPNILFYNTL